MGCNNIIKELTALVTISALMLSVGITAFANDNTNDESVFRKVRIACGFNDLLYLEDDGRVGGYCAEYIKAMSYITHWNIEYVPTDWESATDKLLSGEIDILPAVSDTPQRREIMDFSALESGYMAYGLFVANNSSHRFTEANDLSGVRIAVPVKSNNATVLEEYAKEHGIEYTTVDVASIDEGAEALRTGKADIAVFGALNKLEGCKVIHLFDAAPIYFTVKKGNSELLSELDYGMQQMIANEPEIVGNMYAGTLRGDEAAMPSFTAEEMEFIKSGKEITIGFYEKTAPLAFVDEEGNNSGITIRVLELMKEASGVNMTFRVIKRDEVWQDLLMNGEIDFYLCSSQTISPDDDRFVSTMSFMEYDTTLVTRNNFVFDHSKAFTLAMPRARSHWVTENIGSEVVIKYYETSKECPLAVASGEADGSLMNTIEFNYESRNTRFSDLIQ